MNIDRRKFLNSIAVVSAASLLPFSVAQPIYAQSQLAKGAAKKCSAAKRALAKALSDIKKAASRARSAERASDSAKAKAAGLKKARADLRRLEKSTKRTFEKAKKAWTKSKSKTAEKQMNDTSRAHVKVQRQIQTNEAKLAKTNAAKKVADNKLRDATRLASSAESERKEAERNIKKYCGRVPKPKKALSGKELD